MRMKLMTGGAALMAAGMLAGPPASAQTLVTSFPASDPGVNGVWFENDVRTGGDASIASDPSVGPFPPGAALLTTDFTNAAKAEVGVANNYGNAKDIFPSLNLSYWFYKATNSSQNLTAAPSIKVTVYNGSCGTGEYCFGTLVYEPNWNAGVGPITDCSSPASIQPPVGSWQEVATIDYTTGCFW